MTKLTSLAGAAKFSKKAKASGQTVGLVVGSFDILHLGHINLFRFAKRHIDVLIIGLDNDQTIKLVKGKNRPVNNFKRRSELLSDLLTIDKIFLIEKISFHGSEEALNGYQAIIDTIRPTHIFTHKLCDRHWNEKRRLAKESNITFLLDRSKRVTNSGKIIEKLILEI